MTGALTDAMDRLLGRGRHSTSVPIMDGPLQPNQRLEEAPTIAQADALDNLASLPDGALLGTSGTQLLRLEEGCSAAMPMAQFDAPVTCLAASPHGTLAVGVDGRGLHIRGGAYDGTRIETLGAQAFNCPTALLFLNEHTVIAANGSARFGAGQWKHDLMALGRSGSVWRIDLRNGQALALARQLAFPYGLAPGRTGHLLITEAWAHRIVEVGLEGSGKPRPLLEELPAYPARLVRAARGGYWLACFAPRNTLIEFVLREPRYRERMVAELDPRFWIAPTLAARSSFRVPLQAGAIRQMNVLKPWAPTFSYGLVVRLDDALLPTASLHSRADGTAHGVTSVCEHGGYLIASAKGPGRALRVETLDSDH